MAQYLIMVINEEGEERMFAKEASHGIFAAIDMVKETYPGYLIDAVQVMAKRVDE